MHLHSSIRRLQSRCRGLGTASATQLKPSSRTQEAVPGQSRSLPTPKNWTPLSQQSLSPPSKIRGPQRPVPIYPRSAPTQDKRLEQLAVSSSQPKASPTPFISPLQNSVTPVGDLPTSSFAHIPYPSHVRGNQEQTRRRMAPSGQSQPSNTRNLLRPGLQQDQQRYDIQRSNYQFRHEETEAQVRSFQDRNIKNSIKQPVKSRIARSASRRKSVNIPTTLTVASLAKILGVKLGHLLSRMRRVGMNEEASYDYILTSDYAGLLADEFGFNPIVDDATAFDIYPPPPHPNPQTLPSRPPIVTIMGHVDHGKTTLLDRLRSTSVAKGEAGGITQHIGAFSVPIINQNPEPAGGPQSITFLDTPGHAAFSAMRARGANVTDIVVLVVAADDGIMPQTKEVIDLLKKEGSQVQLVVAINKVDKPGADTDSVKKALMSEGIQLEEFGGDIPAVHVSGLTGQGLPDFVDMLSAVAELQDLRAEQDGPLYGHIIESNFHKGLGPVATVLVRRGSLKVGSLVISGLTHGKVRRMTDSGSKPVMAALPGTAVTVCGWKTLPKVGDEVLEGSDANIRKALLNRVRKAEIETLHEDIEAINTARQHERDLRIEGLDATLATSMAGPKELKIAIKADVSGSGEALQGALHGIGNTIAISKVISTGVGDITESDVMMAKAANATILGFSVSVPRSIQNIAAQNGVSIFTSEIIYRLIEDVRSRIIPLLPTTTETKVVGEATVLQLFDIQLKGKQTMKVAGCRVINGIVEKYKFARLIRSGNIIHQGTLDTLRQMKRDITEARKGTECGLSFKDFSDMHEGDLIQMYEKIEKPGVL